MSFESSRRSAVTPSLPWRGAGGVYPPFPGFGRGGRQAAAALYSNIPVQEYVLAAAAGTYTLSGQNASLLSGGVLNQKRMSMLNPFCPWRGALVDAGQPDFSFPERRAAAYAYAFNELRLLAGHGQYSLVGGVADLYLPLVTTGVYSLAGQDVNLRHGFIVDATVGVYAVVGQNAELIYGVALSDRHRRMSAINPFSPWRGALVDAPASSTTVRDRLAAAYAYSDIPPQGFNAANTGIYTLSGQNATLRKVWKLTAEQGAYSLSGQAANVLAHRGKRAGAGIYVETGQAANLVASVIGVQRRMARINPSCPWRGQLVEAAQAGTTRENRQAAAYMAASPAAVTLVPGLVAERGTYVLNGQTAGLAAARMVVAAQGSYSLAGQDAGLRHGNRLTAETGLYTLAGQSAGLILGKGIFAERGTYVLAGQAVNFLSGRGLAAETGVYTLAGQDIAMYVNPLGFGVYQLVGGDVNFILTVPPGTWSQEQPTAGAWAKQAPAAGSWTKQAPPAGVWTKESAV